MLSNAGAVIVGRFARTAPCPVCWGRAVLEPEDDGKWRLRCAHGHERLYRVDRGRLVAERTDARAAEANRDEVQPEGSADFEG